MRRLIDLMRVRYGGSYLMVVVHFDDIYSQTISLSPERCYSTHSCTMCHIPYAPLVKGFAVRNHL
jgi:hypothetical protein